MVIFFGTLVSFYLSSFFTYQPKHYFVLSFVNAFVAAGMLLIGVRALPAIVLALIVHYVLFVDVAIGYAVLFSLVLPIPPILISQIHLKVIKHVKQQSSVLLMSSVYFLLFGLALPMLQTSLLLFVSYLSKISLSLEFMLLSSSSVALTHMILTPIIFLALSVLFGVGKSKYIALDEQIFEMNSTVWSYRVWAGVLLVTLGSIAIVPESMLLYSLWFFFLVTVFVGIGRFGIIRPMVLGLLVVGVMLYNATAKVNDAWGYDDRYVGLIEVLVAFVVLAYIHGSSTIRSFILSQEKIHNERTDPYTGLYNLAQLKDDVANCKKPILVFLDLWPTLSKLAGIGYSGQTQLLLQITRSLFTTRSDIKRAYRPPFTTGVLFILPMTDNVQRELVSISAMLDEFQFYWKGTSMSLVSHTLHCFPLPNDEDLDAKISTFCDQPYYAHQKILWFDDSEQSTPRMSRLLKVQHAIKHNEFVLYCQPYRHLHNSHSGSHFEVLLRLHPADGSQLEPAEFFPMVNEFGVEEQLDKWVIENTFKLLSENLLQWESINRCAINLTAKSLGDDELASFVLRLAEKYDIPLGRICFEITESAALENEAQAIATVEELKLAGCTIALDDFGTGYASFAYLRRIPVTVLKIDGEFIRNLPTNPTDRLIVESIHLVANNMSLVTVAEYVETEAHADLLREIGIDYAQGFGMAMPLPLDEHIKSINVSVGI
ncbi:EAL domain-containing protein [Enterovibrio sp. ZSDZ42]|uniref:EAL domain-containing protein n=1 Tax=Enterovibrio gelatinilyticus TaxID=2899819 RepID=A0ABT5R7Y9_9GAMM|nr:EAL domain-containing protein [Enterovibrio sp. ZSDZ42]MDD1796320.1 EAL domain-containing protein [Enterovibrio sp. ZSDZ42]